MIILTYLTSTLQNTITIILPFQNQIFGNTLATEISCQNKLVEMDLERNYDAEIIIIIEMKQCNYENCIIVQL